MLHFSPNKCHRSLFESWWVIKMRHSQCFKHRIFTSSQEIFLVWYLFCVNIQGNEEDMEIQMKCKKRSETELKYTYTTTFMTRATLHRLWEVAWACHGEGAEKNSQVRVHGYSHIPWTFARTLGFHRDPTLWIGIAKKQVLTPRRVPRAPSWIVERISFREKLCNLENPIENLKIHARGSSREPLWVMDHMTDYVEGLRDAYSSRQWRIRKVEFTCPSTGHEPHHGSWGPLWKRDRW